MYELLYRKIISFFNSVESVKAPIPERISAGNFSITPFPVGYGFGLGVSMYLVPQRNKT